MTESFNELSMLGRTALLTEIGSSATTAGEEERREELLLYRVLRRKWPMLFLFF